MLYSFENRLIRYAETESDIPAHRLPMFRLDGPKVVVNKQSEFFPPRAELAKAHRSRIDNLLKKEGYGIDEWDDSLKEQFVQFMYGNQKCFGVIRDYFSDTNDVSIVDRKSGALLYVPLRDIKDPKK